jgi:predicted amidophosphoribosyltransferase
MICPNCEKEIANNIAQCPHCGCQFAVKVTPKPTPVVKEQPKPVLPPPEVTQNEKGAVTEKSCPHCGSAITERAVFCGQCGLPVQRQEATTEETIPKPQEIPQSENEVITSAETMPETKFCKHCGKTITTTAAFCKWCGYTV